MTVRMIAPQTSGWQKKGKTRSGTQIMSDAGRRCANGVMLLAHKPKQCCLGGDSNVRNFLCLLLLGATFAASGPNDRQITDPKSVTSAQNSNAKPVPVED